MVNPFTYQTSDLEALAESDNYYAWIFEEIRPFLGMTIAEIGAGIGTFSDLLVHRHLRFHPEARLDAFEPAANLHARLQAGFQERHPDLLEARRLQVHTEYFSPAHNNYDSVVMINVLEHIPDDCETIRAIYESLKPGGTCIVFTPALPQLFSKFDDLVGHQRRYRKQELIQMFGESRYAVTKVKYMDGFGICPWYLVFVLGGSLAINPTMAGIYDKWFVPLLRRIEGFWEPPLGKSLLLVGRKPIPTSKSQNCQSHDTASV